MLALLRKEISEFFSSVTGYVVVAIFLLINSMFIWIFHSEFNVLDMGYANLDSMFILAPWIFLFLIPAVTMRLFAEEKRSGTAEWLLTKPLSDFKIVIAKFLAGLGLSAIALVPTLIYLISLVTLADPPGNIDYGGLAGSYAGLFFLAGVYSAIGVFASSLTKNQIVAFFISIVMCYFFFLGFSQLASLGFSGGMQDFIISLGINDHYTSMSRGVIDSRDVVYFISVTGLFLFITKLSLESRKW
ncbi:MAG TPA: gliding motility-associated ABC transporter permease subunit GldF [Bacteroidales bacterium]|nr:gliding motility-associated ABC transporter permease subunit GldF [Bacteroidales bacterium]HOE05301.1 gliding motility-associated ABC transporter permease subunit GldF [Bacteroidales bacterium]